MRRTSASMASMIASAAWAGGTKTRLQSGCVASTAAAMLSKTGSARCLVPPLPGVTPPTMRVP